MKKFHLPIDLLSSQISKGLGALVLATCLTTAAQGQNYSVTDLGVLPGKKSSTPSAINNLGQVAGTSSAGDSGESAFHFTDNGNGGMLQEIGRVPASSRTRAFGINENGHVVGDSTFGDSSVRHAAFFAKGTAADLGTLQGAGGPYTRFDLTYSRANDINTSGQVVGFAAPQLDSTASRAFIWTAATGMQDIGTLGGAYAQALAINEGGFVTGHAQTSVRLGETHAFLYQTSVSRDGGTGTMLDLGTLGGSSSYGTFINNNKHVVGYSTLSDSENRVHAFLYAEGRMTDLGSLGANGRTVEIDYSVALGVNNSDQVVGFSYLPAANSVRESREPQQVAFLYRRGVMVNLNDLIGRAARTMLLTSATAINDNREIVAVALDYESNTSRAVLLRPLGSAVSK